MLHLLTKFLEGSHLPKATSVLSQILPLTLVLGIMWQVTMLSDLNAIALFSWAQAFNDTVMLLPPVLSGLLGFYILGLFDYKQANWCHKVSRVWLSILIGGFLIVFIGVILGKNYYVFLIFAMYLLGMFCFGATKIGDTLWEKTESVSSEVFYVSLPTIGIVVLVALFYLFLALLRPAYNTIYEKMQITLSGTTSDVKYMSDKYIFLSGGVIVPNTWEYKISMKP